MKLLGNLARSAIGLVLGTGLILASSCGLEPESSASNILYVPWGPPTPYPFCLCIAFPVAVQPSETALGCFQLLVQLSLPCSCTVSHVSLTLGHLCLLCPLVSLRGELGCCGMTFSSCCCYRYGQYHSDLLCHGESANLLLKFSQAPLYGKQGQFTQFYSLSTSGAITLLLVPKLADPALLQLPP